MSTTQADFKAACEKRGLTPSQDLFSFWQDARKPALAASGGNAAPISDFPVLEFPTHARLYYTGVGRRYRRAATNPGHGEPLVLVSEARRIAEAYAIAASAPNAALVAALKAMLSDFEGCYADGEPSIIAARTALSAAGQEVK